MSEENKVGSKLFGQQVEFIIRDDTTNLEGCTLLTGFYGIGKCGFIAINHMVQKLKADRIGYIVTDFLPPFLSVKENKLVLPFEIYRHENLVLLTAYFEPYKLEHRIFAKAVIEWAAKVGIKRSVLVGGLDSRLRTNEEMLAKAVYTDAYKTHFEDPGIPMMDEGLFITGPMALMLMFAEIYDFPAIGILPYAERSRPDPIGASLAVEIINDLLGIDCGVEELVQEAESIENEIQSMEGILQEDPQDEDRDSGMFV